MTTATENMTSVTASVLECALGAFVDSAHDVSHLDCVMSCIQRSLVAYGPICAVVFSSQRMYS